MSYSKYMKGYLGERELLYKLYDKGYVVLRSPRSGRIGLPTPDIVAIKKSKVYAIECKSRNIAFVVPKEQLNQLKEWVEKAGARAYIAWKIPRKGWKFISLEDAIKNNGRISNRFCNLVGKNFEDIFS
ncbi:MAG: Holliday junction resolvase Hjc [Candidatus Aenigmatarchaeota archaeon]